MSRPLTPLETEYLCAHAIGDIQAIEDCKRRNVTLYPGLTRSDFFQSIQRFRLLHESCGTLALHTLQAIKAQQKVTDKPASPE